MGAEVPTQSGIGDSQTGRRDAYAAADRSETGKSNDLCSSGFVSLEVLIAQELRLRLRLRV